MTGHAVRLEIKLLFYHFNTVLSVLQGQVDFKTEKILQTRRLGVRNLTGILFFSRVYQYLFHHRLVVGAITSWSAYRLLVSLILAYSVYYKKYNDQNYTLEISN